MRRKLRLTPSLTVLSCLGLLMATHDFSIGEEPEARSPSSSNAEGPLLVAPSPGSPAKVEAPALGNPNAVESSVPAVAALPKLPGTQPTSIEDEAGGREADMPHIDPQQPTELLPAPRLELTPEMAALRDRVRHTLALYHRQPFNINSNTPSQIMHICWAFGCDSQVHQGRTSNQALSAIGVLCWNYPCAGLRLLKAADGRIMPRIGFGLQEHSSQLLAVLALAKVNSDYEIHIGEQRGTVADLVRYEQLTCRSGTDLSLKLIALAHYLPPDETWTNDLGQPWSLERLVEEEMGRSVDLSDCAATRRLMGLSCAVQRQSSYEHVLEGQFQRAQDFVAEFQQYAIQVQNLDGSWHPAFFARQGSSSDALGMLRSTGHILEWLALSLPADQLADPRVVKSAAYVNSLLTSQVSRRSVTSRSTRDIATLMHALHALAIYDQRVFQPADAEQPEPDENELVATPRPPETSAAKSAPLAEVAQRVPQPVTVERPHKTPAARPAPPTPGRRPRRSRRNGR